MILRKLLVLLFVLSSYSSVAQFKVDWAVAEGGAGWDRYVSVEANRTGEIYYVGTFEGSTEFAGQHFFSTSGSEWDDDILIAKFDAAGNNLWVRQLGSPGDDYIDAVTLDHDGNLIIAGSAFSNIWVDDLVLPGHGDVDMFVAKFEATGDVQWAHLFGGLNPDHIYDLAVDDANNVYFTGFCGDGWAYFDNVTLSSYFVDIVIGKLSKNGSVEWVHNYGGPKADKGLNIAVNGEEVLVTGDYQDWEIVIGNDTLRMDPDIGGVAPSAYLAMKLNLSGEVQWAASTGEPLRTKKLLPQGDDYLIAAYFGDSFQYGNISIVDSIDNHYLNVLLGLLSPDNELKWAATIMSLDSSDISFEDMEIYNNEIYVSAVFIGKFILDSNLIIEAHPFTGVPRPWQINKDHIWTGVLLRYDLSGRLLGYKIFPREEAYGIGTMAFYANSMYTAFSFGDTVKIGNKVYLGKGSGDIILARYTDSTRSGIRVPESGKGILVYPNPVSEVLRVGLSDDPGVAGPYYISVLDAKGSVCAKAGFSGESTSMDISALPEGFYVVVIRDRFGNMLGMGKMLKQP